MSKTKSSSSTTCPTGRKRPKRRRTNGEKKEEHILVNNLENVQETKRKGIARIEVRNIKGLRGSKSAVGETIESRKKKEEALGRNNFYGDKDGGGD